VDGLVLQYRGVGRIRNKLNSPRTVARIRERLQSERRGRGPRIKHLRSLCLQAEIGGCIYETR
jgi:hypothetical protein